MQPAIRIASTVTTKGNAASTTQVSAVQASSVYTSGLSVKSYTDMTKNTVAKIVWGSQSTCDTRYWMTNNGCQGVASPWGFSDITSYSASTKGSVRAWHFLADQYADASRAWRIEKDDEVDVLYYEFQDRYVGSSTFEVYYPVAQQDSIKWAVGTYKVLGAHALASSAAVAALLAIAF